jgi:hypothetical protein
MASCNLVLDWLRATTKKERRSLLRRIRRRVSAVVETPGAEVDPSDPIDALAAALFLECADRFNVTPTELHSLLDNPKDQCLRAIVTMCLSQIAWGTDREDPQPAPAAVPLSAQVVAGSAGLRR